MPKTRNFNKLIDEALADPQRRANIERHRQETVAEILAYNLGELRKAMAITQTEIGRALGCGQSAISALEHSGDPKLSSLREYIEALGGRLEICAVFDEERLRLEV